MSLRARLTLILGSAFVIIWALAAAWMLRDLRQQMMFSSTNGWSHRRVWSPG